MPEDKVDKSPDGVSGNLFDDAILIGSNEVSCGALMFSGIGFTLLGYHIGYESGGVTLAILCSALGLILGLVIGFVVAYMVFGAMIGGGIGVLPYIAVEKLAHEEYYILVWLPAILGAIMGLYVGFGRLTELWKSGKTNVAG